MQPDISTRLVEMSQADNLADELPDNERGRVAREVITGFEIDIKSQDTWKNRMDKALKLASMAKEEKTYPFGDRSSNVVFPLITSAAMQYNARAYPAIVREEMVQCRIAGEDDTGQKAARGERVGKYLSNTIMTRVPGWDEQTDKLTLLLPVLGHVFRKRWYDPAADKFRTELRIPCTDIVVNEGIRSLADAPRISDRLRLYPHEIESRVRSGLFVEFEYQRDPDDRHSPVEFIEQHVRMDLDDDGYEEPYIVTVHRETEQLVRIVAGFEPDAAMVVDGKVSHIDAETFFTSYTFAPSIDNGFLGTGLGVLLGDTSETINTMINQIIDGAHMSSLGGGFIGAEDVKIRGGVLRMSPGEFKQIKATGTDIRQGIVQMDFPEPSPVLFQMLGLMIDMGREIAGVKDVMTGDMPRQQTATTTLALIEQGQMVFTATYKRIYRALSEEFGAFARMILKHDDPERYAVFFDDEAANLEQDFDLSDLDVRPVADPKSVTNMQEIGRAEMLLQLAREGLIDRNEAVRRALKAASFGDVDQLLPEPDPMEAQIQQEVLSLDLQMRRAEIDEKMASATAKMAKAQKDMSEAETEEFMRGMDGVISQYKAMKELIDARQKQLGGLAQPPGNPVHSGDTGGGGGGQQGQSDAAAMERRRRAAGSAAPGQGAAIAI